MEELRDREQVRVLVEKFYERLTCDERIGHFFTGLDLQQHLPRITAFWCGVLFGDAGYSGNPMEAHIKLDRKHRMEQEHMDRWLQLWKLTVNELYTGPLADEAVQRAQTIAQVMLFKVSSARAQ